jgi:hypothetical protein
MRPPFDSVSDVATLKRSPARSRGAVVNKLPLPSIVRSDTLRWGATPLATSSVPPARTLTCRNDEKLVRKGTTTVDVSAPLSMIRSPLAWALSFR